MQDKIRHVDEQFENYMKHNTRPHTLQEISDLTGYSLNLVAALEKKAIEHLREIVKKMVDEQSS